MNRRTILPCILTLLSVTTMARGQSVGRSNEEVPSQESSDSSTKQRFPESDGAIAEISEICGCADLVFVLDVTTSMVGSLDNIKADLPNIIEQARIRSNGDLRLGLITFGDDVTVHNTLTTNLNMIETAISNLFVHGGGCCGPEGSDQALKELVSDSDCLTLDSIRFDTPFRVDCDKVAILITDNLPGGCDDTFTPGIDDLNAELMAQLVANLGIALHTVQVGSGSTTLSSIMDNYAQVTGGTYSVIPSDGTGTSDVLLEIIAACPSFVSLATTILEAGIPDGFTLPIEATSPDPTLAGLLLDCAEAPLVFDELAQNSCFGHTFTGLPDFIVGATLEIRLRAVTEPGAGLQCNDLINLQTTGGVPPFVWTRRLGSEGAFASCAGSGLLPFPWVEGTDYTLVLDLSQLPNANGSITDLIPFLNINGRLDIRVNDDTGVDYARLILVHEADCNGNGLSDINEIWPNSDGFLNGDFSSGSQNWSSNAPGDGTITYNGAIVTVTGRDDGGLGVTSTEQYLIALAGDIFEFDLVSYTSSDTILWDFPVVVINELSYGLNHDGTLTGASGIGTIRNDSPVLSPLHFIVDAFQLAGIGPKNIGFGVRTLNGSGGPGVAVYDNILPTTTVIAEPNCNRNDILDICEMNDSYSGFANGAFDAGGDNWIHAIKGNGSIQYDGRIQVTGDDANVAGVNHVFQNILDLPGGTMEFDLVSYTSTDIGLSDLPVILIDEVPYGLNHDGTLSIANGIGTIRNDSQALSSIHFVVDVENLSGPGAHAIGFGVWSLTGNDGPGVAIFDNITPGLVQLIMDCDLNNILDTCDIETDPSLDLDVNGILDACECQADCATAGADGQIDVLDLIDLLANWGPAVGNCDFVPPEGDGQIDVLELIDLLAAWGACVLP